MTFNELRELTKQPRRYPHACSTCVFLGPYKEFDLYFCSLAVTDFYGITKNMIETVVARDGKEAEDFISRMAFAITKTNDALTIALRRAMELGYDIHPKNDSSIVNLWKYQFKQQTELK